MIKYKVEDTKEVSLLFKKPAYATDGSAAMDIFATYKTYIAKVYTDDDSNVNKIVEFDEISDIIKAAEIHDVEVIGLKYYTGMCVEIPRGFKMCVYPRSSIYKKDLILSNSVGIIDSDYRGEVAGIFKFTTPLFIDALTEVSSVIESLGGEDITESEMEDRDNMIYDYFDSLNIYKTLCEDMDHPEAFAQITVEMALPFSMITSDELSSTERGTGGFGSTDIKSEDKSTPGQAKIV